MHFDHVTLSHHKVNLALHPLREAPEPGLSGHPLLLLHGLGERTATVLPADVEGWPGPVWGLDFTGHGRSGVPVGGGYTCELLVADVDVALGHLGEATLLGRGLGAYVALLASGARPAVVRGAVLADGPGLSGGGSRAVGAVGAVGAAPAGTDGERPSSLTGPVSSDPTVPDPFALAELSADVRPADYARAFAREAAAGSSLDVAVVVASEARPAWLAAVAEEDGVAELSVAQGLELFARR